MSIDGVSALAGNSALPQPLLPARLDAPGLGVDGSRQQSSSPFDVLISGVPGAPQSTSTDPFAALAADVPSDSASTPADSSALTYALSQRVEMMNDVVRSNVVAALSTAANGNSTPIDFSTGASPMLSMYQQYGTGLLGTSGLASLANSQTPTETPHTAPSGAVAELPAPVSSTDPGANGYDSPSA